MNRWVYAARLIGVGFFIAGSIILGLILGLWADSKFNSSFLWLIGLLLGIVVSFWGVYRMLIPVLYKNNKNKNGGSK